MKDVKEQVHERDEPGPALPRVPPIAGEPILTAIGLAGLRDPNTNDRVKDQRQKNQSPFNQRQQLAGAMDQEDTARWKVSVPFSKLALVVR